MDAHRFEAAIRKQNPKMGIRKVRRTPQNGIVYEATTIFTEDLVRLGMIIQIQLDESNTIPAPEETPVGRSLDV